MGDYDIRMRLDIDAERSDVLGALMTVEGISGWWSDTVTGRPDEDGGELYVAFPDLPRPFHFGVGLDGEQVSWETREFPPWWDATTIRWRVEDNPDADGTRLWFTHAGFDPDDEIIPIITPAWAGIIGRLKAYAETGTRDPFGVNPTSHGRPLGDTAAGRQETAGSSGGGVGLR
ncbi:MAG TPA: SRPBCC domain-containing protein [Nitriliruptorales bacterium]|nr:SRPBCC domain-containing protein [Nitriliruptorales bacterium]